jgi:hypothetical protein
MTTTNRRPGRITAGGWGWQHQQARQVAARKVATGTVQCSRCGYPIYPDQAWDLDHADGIDKRLGVYRGPSHRHCNQAAGGRVGGLRRAQRRNLSPPAPRPRALDYFNTSKTNNENNSGTTT